MSKKRLVLVDDDEILLQLMSEELGFYFDVSSFVLSKSAFSYIQENYNEIDILLTDYKMPELSGLELVNKVNEINTKIKRILVVEYYDLIEGDPGLEKCNLVIEKRLMNKMTYLAENLNKLLS